MKFLKVKGIVIKEVKTGEADKIITIFTKRFGKIQAVARGARRPQSRLIAGTQILSFSDFVLFKGKELYVVRDCYIIEPFYRLRDNLEKITYASHIVDILNEISQENLSYSNVLQLTLNTLHMLSNTSKSPELIIRIFEIKLMSIIGFLPEIIECLGCKKVSNENIFFSPKLGGIICSECKTLDKSAIKISSGTLSAMRYIIYSDDKKLFSFEVSSGVLEELRKISEIYLSMHLNKKFNKLEFLQILSKGEGNDYQNF